MPRLGSAFPSSQTGSLLGFGSLDFVHHDAGAWADKGTNGLNGSCELPPLNRQQHHVHLTGRGMIAGCSQRAHREAAVDIVDPHPMLAERFQGGATLDKDNIRRMAALQVRFMTNTVLSSINASSPFWR